jgi:hypothetical protein
MASHAENILAAIEAQMVATVGAAPANQSGRTLTGAQVFVYPPPQGTAPAGLYLFIDSMRIEPQHLTAHLITAQIGIGFRFAATSKARSEVYVQTLRLLQDLRYSLDLNRTLDGRGPGVGGAWGDVTAINVTTTDSAPGGAGADGGALGLDGAIVLLATWREPAVPT